MCCQLHQSRTRNCNSLIAPASPEALELKNKDAGCYVVAMWLLCSCYVVAMWMYKVPTPLSTSCGQPNFEVLQCRSFNKLVLICHWLASVSDARPEPEGRCWHWVGFKLRGGWSEVGGWGWGGQGGGTMKRRRGASPGVRGEQIEVMGRVWEANVSILLHPVFVEVNTGHS